MQEKKTTKKQQKAYRFLVRHEGLHELVELVSLQDLLQVHFRQHHAMRAVLCGVVQVRESLVLQRKIRNGME